MVTLLKRKLSAAASLLPAFLAPTYFFSCVLVVPSFNMKLKIFLKLAQARTSTAFTVRVSETDGESQPISGAGQMRTDQCEGIICLRKPVRSFLLILDIQCFFLF